MLEPVLTGVIIWLVAQLFVSVWWASKLTTRVDELEKTMTEITRVCNSVHALALDIALIRQKVEYIEKTIEKMDNKLTDHIDQENNNG